MPKALTGEQTQFYLDNGYLAPFDGIDAKDAAEMCQDLADFEADQGFCVGTLNLKGHLCFNRSYGFSAAPAILDVVEDLIGPDILVFGTRFWVKSGNDATFVSWHQDSAYFGVDRPEDLVTVWLALTDSHPGNGCVRVIPGTHLGDAYSHIETYDKDNLLTRGQAIGDIDESQAIDLTLKAGQFSCHHERIVHGSEENRAGAPRIGLGFFYIPAHVRSTIGRRTAHLVRGTDKYGHWDDDPAPQGRIDTKMVGHLKEATRRYRDTQFSQEAETAG